MSEQTETVRARIHGRVQGVFYRSWTVQEATRHGLSGWVRNCSDGTVEALFHGPADRVKAMIDACHQGPSAAKVNRVDTAPDEPPVDSGFHQAPSA